MKEVKEFYQPKKRLSATWNSLRVKLTCQEIIHAKGFSKKSASEMKTPVMTVGEPFWTVWHKRDPLALWWRVQPITRRNY